MISQSGPATHRLRCFLVLELTISAVVAISMPACTQYRVATYDAAPDRSEDGDGKAGNGQPCTTGVGCASGNCADGVCCDKSCAGACMSCLSARTSSSPDGTCAPIGLGMDDPQGRCGAATPLSSCGNTGHCDGRGSCEKYGSAITCAAAGCSGGTSTAAATCDGAGHCPVGGTQNCDPYVCGGTACKTTCATSSECATTSYCSNQSCVPKKVLGGICATFDECTTAICGGRCCSAPCTCPQPSAKNLFAPNGGFDADLSGWGLTGLQWSSQDADGCPFSGSAQVLLASGNPRRCVGVTPGTFYNIGGMFRNTSGNLYVCEYTTFAGGDRTGATGVAGSISGSNTAWTLLIATFQVPSNNNSLLLTCDANANTFIDKLFLSPDGY